MFSVEKNPATSHHLCSGEKSWYQSPSLSGNEIYHLKMHTGEKSPYLSGKNTKCTVSNNSNHTLPTWPLLPVTILVTLIRCLQGRKFLGSLFENIFWTVNRTTDLSLLHIPQSIYCNMTDLQIWRWNTFEKREKINNGWVIGCCVPQFSGWPRKKVIRPAIHSTCRFATIALLQRKQRISGKSEHRIKFKEKPTN